MNDQTRTTTLLVRPAPSPVAQRLERFRAERAGERLAKAETVATEPCTPSAAELPEVA